MSRPDAYRTWSNDRDGFAEWLEKHREKYETMEAAAAVCGVNRVTLYDWERHPEKIRVGYLRRFLRKGLMTEDEIMRIIEPGRGKK